MSKENRDSLARAVCKAGYDTGIINNLYGINNQNASVDLISNGPLIVNNTLDVSEQLGEMESESSLKSEIVTGKTENGPSTEVNVKNDIISVDENSGEFCSFDCNSIWISFVLIDQSVCYIIF